MKIDDFMNRSKDLVLRTKIGNTIYIYSNDWDSSHDDYFLALDTQKANLIEYENWEECSHLSFDQLHEVLNLVKELQDTPVKDRFPKKHYRVRLRGFNSDGGHQYLTVSTRYSTISLGSVFAAAWNTGLKQTFTAEELNKIRERFKGSKWIVSMMNDGVEEVGE